MKNFILNMIFNKASVTKRLQLNESYLLVEIEGPQIKGFNFAFGDFIQVSFGDMQVRSYTPIEWDAEEGFISFLVYCHSLESTPVFDVGSTCFVSGPRRSIQTHKISGPVTIIGDERSLGLTLSTKNSGFKFNVESIFLLVNKLEDTIEVKWDHSIEAEVSDPTIGQYQKIIETLPEDGTVLITGGLNLVQSFKKEMTKSDKELTIIALTC